MHLMEDLKLMIKLLLVALTEASVVLTASLLYGLVNCSAVTYRKTLSKFGWRRFDHVKFSVGTCKIDGLSSLQPELSKTGHGNGV